MPRHPIRYALSIAALALLASTLPALAGAHYLSSVSVDLSARVASGSLGTAYNSTDSNQRIGCTAAVYRSGTGFDQYVQCTAISATGTYAICFSDEAILVTSARAISDGSYISFTWSDNNVCDSIKVTNASQYHPKAL